MENNKKYLYLTNSICNNVYQLLKRVGLNLSRTKNLKITEKGQSNFVTNVDLKIEKELIEGLQRIQNIPCLTEETFPENNSNSYWTIDPIDGTTNFIHGYPSYCIAIAKVENNITEYGFVYDIIQKTLFLGIRNNGAYAINTKTGKQVKLNVSSVSKIKDSIIGFGCPYDKTKTDKLFEILNRIIKKANDIKRKGPASLDICYVAAGYLDAYFEYDLHEWDYKAGQLILEEAGGLLTDWNGNAIPSNTSNILAVNGKLVQSEILKELLQN